MSRPIRHDSRERTRRFAELVAKDDTRLEQAAKDARIDPWRALRLLSDPQFRALVDAYDDEWRNALAYLERVEKETTG